MKKSIKYIFPLFFVFIFYFTSCNKENIDYRTPLVGVYQCNLKVYFKHCSTSAGALTLDTTIYQHVYLEGSINLLFKLSYDKSSSQSDYPLDTVSIFDRFPCTNQDSCYWIKSTSSEIPYTGRFIYGYINEDSLYYDLDIGCERNHPEYLYIINGKKLK